MKRPNNSNRYRGRRRNSEGQRHREYFFFKLEKNISSDQKKEISIKQPQKH